MTTLNEFIEEQLKDPIDELNLQVKNGNMSIGKRAIEREKLIVNNLLRDYTKEGRLIKHDGRKK